MIKFYNSLKARGLVGLVLSIILLVVVVPYLLVMTVWDLVTLEWFSAIGRIVSLLIIAFTFCVPRITVQAEVQAGDYRAKAKAKKD